MQDVSFPNLLDLYLDGEMWEHHFHHDPRDLGRREKTGGSLCSGKQFLLTLVSSAALLNLAWCEIHPCVLLCRESIASSGNKGKMRNLMSCTDFRRPLKPWTPCSCLGIHRLLLIPVTQLVLALNLTRIQKWWFFLPWKCIYETYAFMVAVICYSGQDQALLRVKLNLLNCTKLVFIRWQSSYGKWK